MTTAPARQQLPEVQAYLAARAKAEEILKDAFEVIDSNYPQRYGRSPGAMEDWNAYQMERRAIQGVYDDTLRGLWADLKKSDDPLVRWIAARGRAYRVAATMILAALPATVEELDILAARENWCASWERLREAAHRDGVLPREIPNVHRQNLLDWVHSRMYPSRAELNELKVLIHNLTES